MRDNEKYILVSELKKKLNYVCRTHGIGGLTRTVIYEAINKTPAAEVAPVVRGHWETPEKHFPFWDWKCSACGCEEYRQRDSHGYYRMMNFCPNCGAKMDEREDNDEGR